jgi:hypothetical protein
MRRSGCFGKADRDLWRMPRQDRPLQTWKTFLRNHAEVIASIQLFVVPTIAFEQLFTFLVLGHGRRLRGPAAALLHDQPRTREARMGRAQPRVSILDACRDRSQSAIDRSDSVSRCALRRSPRSRVCRRMAEHGGPYIDVPVQPVQRWRPHVQLSGKVATRHIDLFMHPLLGNRPR